MPFVESPRVQQVSAFVVDVPRLVALAARVVDQTLNGGIVARSVGVGGIVAAELAQQPAAFFRGERAFAAPLELWKFAATNGRPRFEFPRSDPRRAAHARGSCRHDPRGCN